MPTVVPLFPGSTRSTREGQDPECRFAADAPTLHVCTDRRGQVVAGEARCFSWARHRGLFEAGGTAS